VPAEGRPAVGDRLRVVAELGGLALAERVDVDDRAEVVEPMVQRGAGRFPDRALGHLPVAEQHVGAVVGTDAARVEGDADRGADPLAERSGGHVHE